MSTIRNRKNIKRKLGVLVLASAVLALVAGGIFSQLEAQQSSPDSRERNRRLFTTETSVGTAGPA
jgi:hypothetical protein